MRTTTKGLKVPCQHCIKLDKCINLHRGTRSRGKKQKGKFWLLSLKSVQQVLKLLFIDFSDIFKQPAATVLFYFSHSPHHCFPLISWWWWLVVVWEEREKMKRWTGCTCRVWHWWYCLSAMETQSCKHLCLSYLFSQPPFLLMRTWAKKSYILGKIGSYHFNCSFN